MGTGEKKRKGELERRIMYVALILYNQFSVISSTANRCYMYMH